MPVPDIKMCYKATEIVTVYSGKNRQSNGIEWEFKYDLWLGVI